MKRLFKTALAGLLLLTATPSTATKVLGLKVIDSQYLMVHFRDGEVHYRDLISATLLQKVMIPSWCLVNA